MRDSLGRAATGPMAQPCPHCHVDLEPILRYHHAGFSDQGFAYCDRDSTVVTFSVYDRVYMRLAPSRTFPERLPAAELKAVEDHLLPCPCGGRFRFTNKPLCPHCFKPVDELADQSTVFILGRRIDGEKANVWVSSGELDQRRGLTSA
jgi:hypothetical protein